MSNTFGVISVWKSSTASLCENGAGKVPRCHVMVGTGLPVKLQAMLTKSPSCTVTVPFRVIVVGTPGAFDRLKYFVPQIRYLFKLCRVID